MKLRQDREPGLPAPGVIDDDLVPLANSVAAEDLVSGPAPVPGQGGFVEAGDLAPIAGQAFAEGALVGPGFEVAEFTAPPVVAPADPTPSVIAPAVTTPSDTATAFAAPSDTALADNIPPAAVLEVDWTPGPAVDPAPAPDPVSASVRAPEAVVDVPAPPRRAPRIVSRLRPSGLRARFAAVFPERQFLYRTDGEVRYVTLRWGPQMAATLLAAGIIAWIGFASGYYLSYEPMMEARERQVDEARDAWVAMVGDVDLYDRQFSGFAGRLDERRQELEALIDRFGVGRVATRAEGAPVRALPDIAPAAGPRLPGAGFPEALAGGWDELTERNRELDLAFGDIQFEFENIVTEHGVVVDERDWLSRQVAELESALAALRNSQELVLSRVTESTSDTAVEIGNVISLTGLDPDALLARLTGGDATAVGHDARAGQDIGQGGPFLQLASVPGELDDPIEYSVAALDQQMYRSNSLQRVMRMLPMSLPVDNYRLTSSFGRRNDPISGRWSLHQGMDLANQTGTPILNTAPGTVSAAGWRGGHGRSVTVVHGLGITTTYSHLREISVDVGQQVGYRDVLGLMGSSGRSTGTHVHYEIRFDGEPLNPMNFIQAGRYVFRGFRE